MPRSVNPVPQYFDNRGRKLSFGRMFYFITGTSDPKTVYKDANQTDAYDPPGVVELDEAGRLPDVFFDGTVKQILESSTGVQIWEREPVSSNGTGGALEPYDATIIYDKDDLVLGSDGKYYKSLQDSNQGNDPTTSPAFWTEVSFLELWNTNVTYDNGSIVKTSDGRMWRSRQASNQGNDPTTSEAWAAIGVDAYALVNAFTPLGDFGITSVVSDGGTPQKAIITFDKSITVATDQTVFVVPLDSNRHYFADPASWTGNTITVSAENLAAAPTDASGNFTVMRVLP